MNRTAYIFAVNVIVLVLAAPGVVAADTLTVTDCGDSAETVPGGGPGQLRKLINDAVSGDTIIVPVCTITLTGAAGEDDNQGGDLDINKILTIEGAGAGGSIIDGGGLDRVFDIRAGGFATIRAVTIRNGNSVLSGGGVRNEGGLGLTSVNISGNKTDDSGGGIYSDSNAVLRMERSALNNNTAGFKGGALFSFDALELTDVLIRENASSNDGGGLFSVNGLTLTNSTLVRNSAGGSGGAIRNSFNLTATNSTISENTANEHGGGIFHSSDGGTVTLINMTITQNTADADNAGFGSGGGIFNEAMLEVNVRNVILSGNTVGTTGSGPDCSGSVTSAGHNLIQNPSGCVIIGTTTGNITGANAVLGALALNGGRTPTQALLAGSPAIDAGDDTACPPTDQRGVRRPLNGNNDGTVSCDIGAYERLFVDAGLTLGIELNQPSYGPGDTLTLDVTAANPTGPETPVDAYLGFVLPASAGPAVGCPGGDAIAFLTAGLAGFEIHCASDSVSAFPRLVQQTSVPAALPPVVVNDFLVTGVAGAPPGVYTVFLLLTVPNGFVDEEIGPEDIIRVAIVSFIIP